MTLIMIWREGPADRLWVVADSRLTGSGPYGQPKPLTDRAAKVLEAHVCLQGPNPKSPLLTMRTVGFAYAGSSLIALQAYVAVLPLWARLWSPGDETLPTMKDCAEHLGFFLRSYGQEVLECGSGIATECALLGYDDAAGRVEAWRVRVSQVGDTADLKVAQLELGDGQLELIGSGAHDAKQNLEKINPTGRPWRREPLDMIRHQLREDTPGTVGGGVQVGVAVAEGFQLYSDARPFRAGVSRAGDPLLMTRYRGFDSEKIHKVGHAIAKLPGIKG
ncbi:MAG: hypothetical protein ACREEB_01350 [Caulobacteraceae bacterium]